MRCSRAKTRGSSNMAGSIGAASLRALYRDIMSGSAKEGASSITQQLARNSLPLGGRTLSRKLLEAMVALRIERDFTKQQILELYVNRIYFGSGCYGVETASLAYFGKRRVETESFGSRAAGRTDSQPESVFAARRIRRAQPCNETPCSIGCSS